MAQPEPVDVPTFAATQLELLAAELQSEIAQTAETVGGHTPAALQRAGVALINLVVGGRRTGMGGRTVLTLEGDAATSSSDELPEHGLRTGDVVLVAEQPGGSAKKREMRDLEKRGVHGVVTRVRRTALEVAVDNDDGDSSSSSSKAASDEHVDTLLQSRVWLLKLADEVTHKRMASTMRAIQNMPAADYTPLMRVLFGLSSPGLATTTTADAAAANAVEWVDPTLNDSQKDAVRFALAAPEVALIHGPPGTGKTHTLVELILQLVRRDLRVLVCGPSNIAVDNLVERLAPHAVPMVRLGHPARLLPSVLGHALDVLTQTSAAGAIVRDVRADMDARQADLKKPKQKGGPANKTARRAIYSELRDLRREYRERERRCTRELVGGSKVVLATLHGAGGSQLRVSSSVDGPAPAFDVVVIDEASQALEAQCWVPLLAARKVVLAGDHLQLPPTVKAAKADAKVAATKKKTTKDKTAPRKEGAATDAASRLPVDKLSLDAKTGQTGQTRQKGQKGSAITLEYTLFDRLLDLHGSSIKRMLTTQYRMHERIMRFPSDTLYEGKLVAAESVAGRLLRDIQYSADAESGAAASTVADVDETREPLVFIDTQGGEFPETTDEEAPNDDGDGKDAKDAKSARARLFGDSKCNAMEALLVRQHVRTLVRDGGLRAADIAVVTPYNAQLALLSGPLKQEFPGIELGSVDGFQGREKEAVVVSLVRSNAAGDVGFLAEKRRLNGGSLAPSGSAFLKSWMDFLEENADLRYPDASAVVAES
ncbi:hypothetical protein HMPREF1624_08098 [Sporothrix schenckii ATCC 58251]|uniref:DNA helicase n=1 Tax=Sporothrix schenckii (strain ATCC 58251 / de Perez 2211183) TaxID=1391915 RepID=U7PJ69_SPOS1|nr:hypothetical protein HMPREF1624_08098 [Sporothrix schenckii ATCC 58251]